jgi:hypothetical protein
MPGHDAAQKEGAGADDPQQQGDEGDAQGDRMRLMQQRRAADKKAAGRAPQQNFTAEQLVAIQRELARLKLYTLDVDGKWGPGTRGGLDHAIPDWQQLSPDDILVKLKAEGGGDKKDADKDAPAGAADKANPAAGWNDHQTKAIQKELIRLGLYQGGLDGKFGKGTESGLVEAFGGEEWKQLTAEKIAERLVAAKPPAGKKGEHDFKYGEMFKDGVLDMTLGIGFDEGGSHEQTIKTFGAVLAAHGFKDDRATATRLYQQAGRQLGASAFGNYFVRENAIAYKPPAGDQRYVHAVVRLVANADGSKGSQAAGAFKEGMAQSDVSYYSGHGRYGSGPDFDRNMSFELYDEKGNVEQNIDDYEVLERALRDEGKAKGRDAWAQFQWRVAQNRIKVDGANEGNVYMNPQDMHQGEFGAKLMYWNLSRKSGGAKPITGKGGELDQMAQQKENAERKYRLMVFDGCRTQDYIHSLRSTPGQDEKQTDVLATKRTLMWGDESETLAAFLDGVLGQQSAESVVKGMDSKQSPENAGGKQGGAYVGFGLGDNPQHQ